MTVKLSSLKADLAREAKGDWVPSLDIPGVEFNVSSLTLPAYRVDLRLMEQRLARQYKGKPIPSDITDVEVGKLLHKHILHDWKGFDVPYSRAAAEEMLCQPEGRPFISAVQNAAAALAIPDIEFIEEAGKNSERPSAGD